MKKPRIELFMELCNKTGGNLSAIAQSVGVARRTVYSWIDEDVEFKNAITDARESLLDFTESQKLKLIQGIPSVDEHGKFNGWIEKPDTTLIIFTLKTLGRNRGYGDRLDIHTIKVGLDREEEENEIYERAK